MKYTVAATHEVSINGRRYMAGDELPEVAGIAIESLIQAGVVKAEGSERQARQERTERAR